MSTPPPPPEAPSTDVVLLALPRFSPQGEPPQRLRVALSSYQGHSYVEIRLWQQEHGAWRATPKGISIRVRELAAVRDALDKALATLAAERPR